MVWLVAVAATFEAVGQAMDAAWAGNVNSELRWIAIATMVFIFAGLIENLKVFREA